MRSILFIVMMLFAWSCKKIDLPIIVDPQQAQPIFEISVKVAGNPVMLTAGLNNYSVMTDYQSGPLEILTLDGILRDQTCTAKCKPSLQIKLRYRLNEFLRDTTKNISPGRMSFYKSVPDTLMMKVNNNSVLSNSSMAKYSYLWTIDDKKYTDKESFHININPKLNSKVCLQISHPDGSKASQCQAIDFISIDSFPGLKVAILPSQLQNKQWILNAKVNGIGPFKFSWDTKSNTSSAEFDNKSESNHCVTVTDARGNMASACIDMQPEAKVKSRADFDLEYDKVSLKQLTQFNTVELIYVDENGSSWSTAGNLQRPVANFEILEVSRFQDNASKQATRKLKITFDADFYNATRSSIAIKGSGSIAVAFPR